MTNARLTWLVTLVTVVAVIAVGFGMASSEGVNGVEDSAGPPGSLDEYSGLVSASSEVELGAPMEGRLLTVGVVEGDRVKADQLLAKLDDRAQVKRVAASRLRADQSARLRRAEAVLDQAKLKRRRLKEAHAAGAASDWEIEQAKAELEQAKAELAMARHRQAQAQAELALEKQRLARYQIRAPFPGRVRHIRVDAGATLTPEKTLLALVKLDPLEAEMYLPVTLYGRLERGRRYRLQGGEPVNGPLTATLQFISPVIDSASRTFRCVFKIDNPRMTLPAGFTVHLADLTPAPAKAPETDKNGSTAKRSP